MSNAAFETLKRNYHVKFTDNWSRDGRAWVNFHEPAFVVYSGDGLHQNTIDDSNVETIYNALNEEFPHLVSRDWRPYVVDVYVSAEELEENEELADRVLEIMEAMDNYAIFDESHHSDLEHARLVEYMNDTLPYDLANELDRDDDEELAQWVRDNVDIVWEHNDGSVDDVPFNVEELAALVS